MPHGPLLPVGHKKIDPSEMGQRYLSLNVSHREVVSAAVVKVATTRDADIVSIDECLWHHCDFWPPVTIMGRLDADPPDQHTAQILNARNAIDRINRSAGHGRFE